MNGLKDYPARVDEIVTESRRHVDDIIHRLKKKHAGDVVAVLWVGLSVGAGLGFFVGWAVSNWVK